MKRNQSFGLTLASLLLLGAAGPARATFTGDFAPSNWEQISPAGSNPGTFAFSGGVGNDEILTITGSTTPGASDTILAVKSPYSALPGTLSFTWSLVNYGNDGAPLVFYYIDGTQYPLSGAGGTLSGISLPANTFFAFELSSNVVPGKKDAAVFEISNWQFTPIPEPATWLPATFALGVLLLEVFRRKRHAPAAGGRDTR